MKNLGELWDQLVATSRPYRPEDPWPYDRDKHRDALNSLVREAKSTLPTVQGEAITASEAELSNLFEELFTNFDSGKMNPWRAHGLFCISLQKLMVKLRASLTHEITEPVFSAAAG